MKTRRRILGPTLLLGLLAFSGGARGERGAPTPAERDASIHRALGWLGKTTPGLADAGGTPTKEFTYAMTGLVFEMARGTAKDPVPGIEKYLARWIEGVAEKTTDPSSLPPRHGLASSEYLIQYTWPAAMAGVFFSERYLAGRSRGTARKALARIVRILEEAQAGNGGWGHGRVQSQPEERAEKRPERLGARTKLVFSGYPSTLLASSNTVASALGIIEAALGRGTVKGLDRARAYYRSARLENGNFPYDPSQRAAGRSLTGVSRTGGALLAMHFLGIPKSDPEFAGSFRFLTEHLDYASEGHGSSMLNLAHTAFALKATDDGEWKRFRNLYYPRILAHQAEDGSFTCVCEQKAFGTTCDSRKLGRDIASFRRREQAYVTSLLTFVLLLGDTKLKILDKKPVPAPARVSTPRPR